MEAPRTALGEVSLHCLWLKSEGRVWLEEVVTHILRPPQRRRRYRLAESDARNESVAHNVALGRFTALAQARSRIKARLQAELDSTLQRVVLTALVSPRPFIREYHHKAEWKRPVEPP